MIPTTSHPEFRASIVAAEMTEFIPGAGPPPHRIPSFMHPSFQPPEDPDKRTGPGRGSMPFTNPDATTRHGPRGVYLAGRILDSLS